jgi:hypothetical protein
VVKLLCSVALGLLAGGFLLRAQDATQPKKPDAFFSGAVTECTAEKVSVARRISGKQEKRTFRITAATIVEGKLQPKARVTVQYSTDDAGDTATRVVVHTAPAKK